MSEEDRDGIVAAHQTFLGNRLKSVESYVPQVFIPLSNT